MSNEEKEPKEKRPNPLLLGLQKAWTSIKERRAADKLIAAAVTASVAAVAVGGYVIVERTDKLQSRVEAAEKRTQPNLRPLQADVAKLSSSVAALSKQGQDLAKLLEEKDPVPAEQVSEIAQKVAGATTELAKLSGRLEQVADSSQGATADHARELSRLASLVGQQSTMMMDALSANTTSVEETKQKVALLSSRLTALETGLKTTQKTLVAVQTGLAKQQTALDAQAAALGEVRATLSPLPGAVASLQTQVTPLPSQMTSLQGTIDAVDSLVPIAIGQRCCVMVAEGQTIDKTLARVKTSEGDYLLSVGGGDNHNCNGGAVNIIVDGAVVGKVTNSYGNCQNKSIDLPPVHLSAGTHEVGVRLSCISGNGVCGYSAWGTLQRIRP